MRMLIVDDEPGMRRVLTRFLKIEGHVITEASDGEEALGLFNQEPQAYELVLTDVRMPRMGGVDLVRQLRAQGHVVQTILMAGHVDTELAQASDTIADCQVLKKPFRLAELKRILSELP